MSDDSLLPTDAEIVAAAARHARESRERRWETPQVPQVPQVESGFPILHHNQPVAWVKWGGVPHILEGEAATQAYVYEMLHENPALLEFIRVPEVYRIIQIDEFPRVLVVMEYVHGRTVRRCLEGETTDESRDRLWSQILCALNTLLSFQPPPNTAPGPAGGGGISHMIFGEYCEHETAPRDFNSVQDLENFINLTIDIRGVNFLGEDLKLCYCDPHQSNFIVPSDGGSIYVIDFEHCFWLPPSLMSWALFYNFRDEIFSYLRENLEELQQLSQSNHTALGHFNVQHLRRQRARRGPPPPPPPPSS